MQREIPMFAVARKPAEIGAEFVSHAADMLDAVRLCVQMSRLSNESICNALGIDPGHWTRMMQGRASLPLRKLPDLMRVCGNLAPLQFLAREMGFELFADAKAQRRAELEAELAALDRKAG